MTTIQSDLIFLAGLCVVIVIAMLLRGGSNDVK